MSYTKSHGPNNYPSHLVPNEEKGQEWLLQYCKAAWHEYNGTNAQSFYHARFKHHRTKEYAMGNQPINKYKPVLGVTDDDNSSYLNIDWSVLPIIPKFRRIALNKLAKSEYNITATPIDSLAIGQKNRYFENLKKKLFLYNTLADISPETPGEYGISMKEDEPMDLQELSMQEKYTYKHQMAIEMEQAIELVLYQNDWTEVRKRLIEDLFDDGVAVVKETIDSNGAIKLRRVNPAQVIVSNCSKNDFSDKQHVGEIRELSIADLKAMAGKQFSEEQYKDIASTAKGFGAGGYLSMPVATPYSRQYDDDKIRIIDMELYSVNSMLHEERIDKRGNSIYKKVPIDYKRRQKNKYTKTDYKVVYKCKWIIGTDYVFDFGLCTDMKREKNKLMETEMSYHIYAPDYHNFRALGIMEQLIPIADNIQIAYYRLQQAIAEARPKGIMIEMGALEDIPLGASGQQLTPSDVLDLFNKKGVLVYRKVDIQGRPTNYRPIEELQNGIGNDVMNYFGIIQQNIQMIRDITGLNEFTDGSTPDARALTTTAKLAAESTNNALGNVHDGEKHLLEKLAKSIVIRVQDIIQKGGNIEGYTQALGGNTINFFKASETLSVHEFGMKIEDKPDDEARARLLQFMQANLGQGMIEMEDAIMVESADNLKVAQQILAYRIKKRKAEMEAKAIRQQEMNGQIQMQSAQAAEQAKQQTIQVEAQVKMQMQQAKAQMDMELQKQKYEFEMKLEEMKIGMKAENQGALEAIKQQGAMPTPPQGVQSTEPALPVPENMENTINQQ